MRKPGSRAAAVEGLERLSSQPFLTEEQRAALDAALAKKQAEADSAPPPLTPVDPSSLIGRFSSGKASSLPAPKSKREVAHDHHTSRRTKGSGRAKKGGSGGKYTWGGLLEDEESGATDAVTDRRDPNYDSGEDGDDASQHVFWRDAARSEVAAFKAGVTAALAEFYGTGDLTEVAACLRDLGSPQYGYWVVKRAVVGALDRHDREREMTSVLLAALHGELLTSSDLRKGFQAVAAELEDLELDVPGAADAVALFVCRAVVDDALAPAFLSSLDTVGPAGEALARKCRAHLAAKHAAERLARCWGGTAGFDLEESRASIKSMLEEYASGRDVEEVRRRLHDLAVPFFHHELVKQARGAIVKGLETGDVAPYVALLSSLAGECVLSTSQVGKGFGRVSDLLADIELDVPTARETFEDMVAAATKAGWLEEGFQSGGETPMGSPNGLARSHGNGGFRAADVGSYKSAIKAILREYFDAGDPTEVARSLAELDEPGFHHIFVKYAVQLALDRKDRERELVSALLPTLVPSVISHEQACLGFSCLVAAAEDLTLDIPDAEPLLSLFLGRAIVDEVVPPRFLVESVPRLRGDGASLRVIQHAGAHLSARHAGERLGTCWHERVSRPAELASAMREAVNEYTATHDVHEAERCLSDLAVPHFHHEFVVRSLLAACAHREQVRPILDLLASLAASGLVTETQLKAGFSRVEENLDDIVLDFPLAVPVFEELKGEAEAAGWLPQSGEANGGTGA
ncbi:Programmed cell death protein 4 [Auxenochlorella protothecoides]|uniref:Programmed cell death protein 4 n=1 Tax=Auxenochlorella protothecoides TaxID=3075 RepID=A0A087SLH1_AUXPR|nr:Programmed cell death protein 4 [Auxenochlorella protothecoides]KFM26575.1 Programmed cell death protein 4 [Auxenochlorella protothecoides]